MQRNFDDVWVNIKDDNNPSDELFNELMGCIKYIDQFIKVLQYYYEKNTINRIKTLYAKHSKIINPDINRINYYHVVYKILVGLNSDEYRRHFMSHFQIDKRMHKDRYLKQLVDAILKSNYVKADSIIDSINIKNVLDRFPKKGNKNPSDELFNELIDTIENLDQLVQAVRYCYRNGLDNRFQELRNKFGHLIPKDKGEVGVEDKGNNITASNIIEAIILLGNIDHNFLEHNYENIKLRLTVIPNHKKSITDADIEQRNNDILEILKHIQKPEDKKYFILACNIEDFKSSYSPELITYIDEILRDPSPATIVEKAVYEPAIVNESDPANAFLAAKKQVTSLLESYLEKKALLHKSRVENLISLISAADSAGEMYAYIAVDGKGFNTAFFNSLFKDVDTHETNSIQLKRNRNESPHTKSPGKIIISIGYNKLISQCESIISPLLTDDDKFLSVKSRIIELIEDYLKDNLKIHRARAEYIKTLIDTSDTFDKLEKILLVNSQGQKLEDNDPNKDLQYSKRPPKHLFFSYGYKKLMKKCMAIAEENKPIKKNSS